MIDVTRETIVSLVDVARRLGVTVQTVRNWSDRQSGPRLDTMKFGGKVVTSWEALGRFGRDRDGGSAVRGGKPRPNAPSTKRRVDAAEKYLQEIGI